MLDSKATIEGCLESTYLGERERSELAMLPKPSITMSVNLLLFLLAVTAGWARSQNVGGVTFDSRHQDGLTYDTIPKLRIRCTGLETLVQELDSLELTFEPPLTKEKIYKTSVNAVDNNIDLILDLVPGKTWMEFGADEAPPKTLLLRSAALKDVELLSEPVKVASIIRTPVVYPSKDIVYMTVTPFLVVNGTNFNTKETKLFFSPPLVLGEDISIMVKSSTKILVKLIKKSDSTAAWAPEPGPLKLIAINTGAGMMNLQKDLQGVTISEVQADMSGHGIKVFPNEDIAMYQSKTKTLTIAGEGFAPGETVFRFGNAIKENSSYTAEVTSVSASLTLTEGSKWKMNSVALPSPLILLAANAGDGWVPLGATTGKAGRKVATIFEDPSIEESSTELSRTRSHDLTITGSGFTEVFQPHLVFEPRIERDDYVVNVLNRTHVIVSLGKSSAGWVPENEEESSNLYITAVNTGAGVMNVGKVKVAVVKPDAEIHDSGIHVRHDHGAKLYQSSPKLMIDGVAFPEAKEIKLTFGDLVGPDEGSFSTKRISELQLELSLLGGHKWSNSGGAMYLVKISFDDVEVEFSTGGILVTTVLEDPIVEASQLLVYASHTKRITIKGQGLLSAFDPFETPKVVLSPTPIDNFEVVLAGWTTTSVTLALAHTEGSSNDIVKWAEVEDEDHAMPLKVMSIDMGAGIVEMPGGGIVVASIRMDDGMYICDDSCIYANDQMCDEEQEGKQAWGWSRASISRYASSAAAYSISSGLSRSYAGGPDESFFSGSDDLAMNIPSCEIGTDCTDCGANVIPEGKCENTCEFARDNQCDDRRGTGVCPSGTDCQDCGKWGMETNSTNAEGQEVMDSAAFSLDTSDQDFLAHWEDPLLMRQQKNAKGRYHLGFKENKRTEYEGGEQVFIDVLWAAIVLVGAGVSALGVMFAVRCAKGERVDLPIPTNPDVEGRR